MSPAHDRDGHPAHEQTAATRSRPSAPAAWLRKRAEEFRRPRRRAGGGDDRNPETPPLHARQGSPPLTSRHRLGELTRSNSEAIIGARTFRRNVDFSRGVAITSSFYPDDQTHIEPVRYGRGSNAMGLLTTGPRRRRRAISALWPGRGEVARPPAHAGAKPEHAPMVRADHRRPRHAATGTTR